MIIKQFYRPDRRYWYKLILSAGRFYIIYDYRVGKIGTKMNILEHNNKNYVFDNIDDALKTFNAWKNTYGEKEKM